MNITFKSTEDMIEKYRIRKEEKKLEIHRKKNIFYKAMNYRR